jgi:hypothetical protein
MLELGSIIRDEYGQRFTCVSIRKFNPNHDERGRFTFGSGVDIQGLPFEPIPKSGTNKDKVYQTYLKYGREAALEHGRALGMSYRAPAIMVNRWQAQGIEPGTEKGFVLPPGLDAPKPPVNLPKPQTDITTTKPTGPLSVMANVGSYDSKHVGEIQKGINAIPAEHQIKLADSGLRVVAVNKIRSPSRGMKYLGMHYSDIFSNSHAKIEVAKGTTVFGRTMNAKDVVGTTVHELGHGIDHINGWKYGPALAKHVDEDAKQMSDFEKQSAKYYFSNDKERFAELYKTAYTPGDTAFNMPINKAKKVFAKSISKMNELVG